MSEEGKEFTVCIWFGHLALAPRDEQKGQAGPRLSRGLPSRTS